MSTRGMGVPLYVSNQSGAGASLTVRPTIPSSDDDSVAGFLNGSQLYSTAAQATYLCVDAAAGLWQRTNRHYRRNLWHTSPQVVNTIWTEPADWATDGTITTPAPAPGGTLRAATWRTNYEAPAGAPGGVRTPLRFFRSTAAGQGGVRLAEFWIAPNTAGITSGFFYAVFSEANIAPGTDPNTLTNVFGFAKRGDGPFGPADTELHLVTGDGGGVPTWTPLGADFPANNADLCALGSLYWSPDDGGHLYAQLERQDAPGLFVADVTANLPDVDTLLLWIATCHDLTPATVVSFDLAYAEIEHL